MKEQIQLWIAYIFALLLLFGSLGLAYFQKPNQEKTDNYINIHMTSEVTQDPNDPCLNIASDNVYCGTIGESPTVALGGEISFWKTRRKLKMRYKDIYKTVDYENQVIHFGDIYFVFQVINENQIMLLKQYNEK